MDLIIFERKAFEEFATKMNSLFCEYRTHPL